MKAREQFLKAYDIGLTRRKHLEKFALLLCLELILAFSYLGFIELPPISVTTLPILVIVAAMYFGPMEAGAVGLIFGCASMWKASVTSIEIGDVAFSPILSGQPFESIVMAVFTRVAFAVIAGLMFKWFFSKERKYRRLGISVIAIIATIVHAILVYARMLALFNAANVETSDSFWQNLAINTIILFAVTVLVVIGFDALMQGKFVRNFLELTAAKKSITLHENYSEVSEKYLFVDADHANRVMANILSNAIKYTEPGGEVWYSFREIPSDREGYARIQVSVRGTGKGMTKEFVDKIFEPFERAESATKSRTQGTGLGMSIVKELVDMMGGEIRIESEPGVGTTVTTEIYHRIPTRDEIEEYEKSRDGSTSENYGELGNRTILIVEDNELNREIAVNLLIEEGMLVEEAEDGSVAVEMLREKGPDYYDFILMDIQMPIMDGYEATRCIREMYPDSDIPIIALSANAFSEDRQASIEAGMNEHVAKPIDVAELFSCLSRFL